MLAGTVQDALDFLGLGPGCDLVSFGLRLAGGRRPQESKRTIVNHRGRLRRSGHQEVVLKLALTRTVEVHVEIDLVDLGTGEVSHMVIVVLFARRLLTFSQLARLLLGQRRLLTLLL